MKTRYYIIDGLNYKKGTKLYKALKTVSGIKDCSFNDVSGIVEITSKKDVRKQLDLACSIAGLTVRIEVYKNN